MTPPADPTLKTLVGRAPWVAAFLLLLTQAAVLAADCNRNGAPDADDLAAGTSTDCNSNGLPDECDARTVVFYPAPSQEVLGADLDGDGYLDLAAGHLVLGNRGDGAFVPAGELPLDPGDSGSAAPIAAGDLDGDGDQDLQVASWVGGLQGGIGAVGLSISRNHGAWSFRREGSLFDGSVLSHALGDLDGDGDPDAVLCGYEAGAEPSLLLLSNDGDASFEASWSVPAATDRAVALGDLDGDGDLDLATHSRIFPGAGDGTFTDPTPTGWGIADPNSGPFSLTLGDLDGDGDLDLAAGEYKTAVVLWNRDGSLAKGPRASSHSGLHALVPADLDADGDFDLASNWYPILNAGDGTFHLGPFGVSWALGFSGHSIVAADLDGDGDVDLAGGDDRGGVKVALGFEGLRFGISRDFDSNGIPDECELPCGADPEAAMTDGFRFIATSDQGAVGDVVAVDVFLEVEDPRLDLQRIHAVGSYDASMAELLAPARYSEVWDRIAWFPELVRFRPDTWHVKGAPPSTLGFVLSTRILRDSMTDLLPTPGPIHLATLYFRLHGSPGDSFELRFADDVFGRPLYLPSASLDCLKNELTYLNSSPSPIHSRRHAAGLIRILPGEATRPEPPDLPPLARVYPEAPTRETAEITFELTGGFVSAGETGVPVDLFITSNFEFSGYTAGVTFPPEYLSVSRVEEHVRPGIMNIDNARGNVVLAMLNGLQRVGAEGERVRIATLFLDVGEAATEVNQLELRLEPAGTPPISNWVEIRHLGAASGAVPIATQVEPLTLEHALLNVLPEVVVFIRGDSNWDKEVNVSDAAATLNYLFLGSRSPICLDAADANDDGTVNITDPLATLGFLFLGGQPFPPPAAAPGQDPTPDELGCFRRP